MSELTHFLGFSKTELDGPECLAELDKSGRFPFVCRVNDKTVKLKPVPIHLPSSALRACRNKSKCKREPSMSATYLHPPKRRCLLPHSWTPAGAAWLPRLLAPVGSSKRAGARPAPKIRRIRRASSTSSLRDPGEFRTGRSLRIRPTPGGCIVKYKGLFVKLLIGTSGLSVT